MLIRLIWFDLCAKKDLSHFQSWSNSFLTSSESHVPTCLSTDESDVLCLGLSFLIVSRGGGVTHLVREGSYVLLYTNKLPSHDWFGLFAVLFLSVCICVCSFSFSFLLECRRMTDYFTQCRLVAFVDWSIESRLAYWFCGLQRFSPFHSFVGFFLHIIVKSISASMFVMAMAILPCKYGRASSSCWGFWKVTSVR